MYTNLNSTCKEKKKFPLNLFENFIYLIFLFFMVVYPMGLDRKTVCFIYGKRVTSIDSVATTGERVLIHVYITFCCWRESYISVRFDELLREITLIIIFLHFFSLISLLYCTCYVIFFFFVQ